MTPDAPRNAGRPRSIAGRRRIDRAFVAVCVAAASISVGVLLVLLASILREGWSRLDLGFLTSYPSRSAEEAGFKAALWGSVWLCLACAAIALPVGVASAVLLEEYAPRARWPRRLHQFIQLNIQNLAGVPSIVYGIIGLTVFVRMFGLLGNPNQYDSFLRVTRADGRVVEGIPAEDRPATYVIDLRTIAGATPLDPASLPQGVEVPASIVQGDHAALEHAPIGGEVTIPLVRDFNLPFDLAMALEPAAPTDPPAPFTITGVLTARRDGALVIDVPLAGRVEIPADDIRRRERRSVRVHDLLLASGERLRAPSLVASDSEFLVPVPGEREPRRIPRDQVAGHRAVGPIEVGREDSPLYFRLPLGGGVLAGALTLALVILPVIIISSQEALRAVPASLREGALAAGATRWQVVSRMVLPSAMPGIMTGAILAMSRAIGEAAPLLVIGGILFITFTPVNLMSDFAAMPLQIYQWASRPQTEFASVAAAGIIVLLVVLLLFNGTAILIRRRFRTPG